MAYEMMVGLQVKNSQIYQEYRDAMAPLLAQYGGGFRYDFMVSKTLKSITPEPINRVFAIYFKDEASMTAFFSHPDYVKIKQTYFENSVEATTIISSYERNAKASQ
ncbi:MAG: DUF1330 domain-containing protein [Oligoflexus sp.]